MAKGNREEVGLVTFHREGHVGFVTLNIPEKRNALNPTVWGDLEKALGQAEEDEANRVVILRGKGKSFCSGLDLSPEHQLNAVMNQAPTAAQKTKFFREVRRAMSIHNRLERLPQPTIAVIQGHCLGAGLELALCCDFRFCTEGTVFSLPEARYAVIVDVGGLQRLPKIVGRNHAREIIFRGHQFDAGWAHKIQLVNNVFPDEETLFAKALELAEEIAGHPPLAVQGAKEVLLFDEEAGLRQSLAYNAARSSMILPSEDSQEARSARREGRKGEFKGA
jgi:enoyl-CoA hydratase